MPAIPAFDNYNELVAVVQDWLDRSDLSGSAPSMIGLAEARMRRELMPHFGEVSTTIATSSGLGTLPGDFGTIARVMYDGRALPQHSAVGATDVPEYSGRPYAYTIEQDKIRVWPAGNFTLQVLYQPVLSSISAANQTNDLLLSHPDLYFFGAMLFAEGYLANDARAANFKALFDEALQSAKDYFIRQRFAGPLTPRVVWLP